jgi:hypothetical protein
MRIVDSRTLLRNSQPCGMFTDPPIDRCPLLTSLQLLLDLLTARLGRSPRMEDTLSCLRLKHIFLHLQSTTCAQYIFVPTRAMAMVTPSFGPSPTWRTIVILGQSNDQIPCHNTTLCGGHLPMKISLFLSPPHRQSLVSENSLLQYSHI